MLSVSRVLLAMFCRRTKMAISKWQQHSTGKRMADAQPSRCCYYCQFNRSLALVYAVAVFELHGTVSDRNDKRQTGYLLIATHR